MGHNTGDVLYVDLWDSGVKCVYKFNLLVGWLHEHLIVKDQKVVTCYGIWQEWVAGWLD